MSRTEREKMVAGELYEPNDAELKAERAEARVWMLEYNNAFAASAEERQALLRRRPSDGADIAQLQIHDLHLDLLSRKVSRAGERLELTAKEFSLLSLLARHQGQILSKMMIAEQIWDMNFDSDANVVEVAIKRLRSKIDAPYEMKLLHTVRGMGYVLEVRPERQSA